MDVASETAVADGDGLSPTTQDYGDLFNSFTTEQAYQGKRASSLIIRELRKQAELYRRQEPLDQDFTLVSGAVQIHQDDPV